jgi:hypothetical protein
MSRRLLVDAAPDGTREIAHFDADGNLTALQWTADVEPVIEANKRAQNDGSRGWGTTREWRKVASIPVAVLMEYCQSRGIPLEHALGGPGQREAIGRMLADSDYRYLRTDT